MAQKEQATANRNYKDTVFRMLFSDRQNLLSLYNAVSGSHYDDPEMLEIVTLENAIYMGMKNDLAFIIGTDLFLYEHQSTYNPNMPLRDLFYISSEYQKLVDHKSLYSSTLLKIPAPQFIVFYNGTEKKKDHWLNHLSESFENLSGEPKLELEVLTININEGLNKELMEQCQTLREYAQYVHCVRKYAKELDLNEAVKLAVDECIRNDILYSNTTKKRKNANYEKPSMKLVWLLDSAMDLITDLIAALILQKRMLLLLLQNFTFRLSKLLRHCK